MGLTSHRAAHHRRTNLDAAPELQEEHGRVEESIRQNLIMAFNTALRSSTMVGIVDTQRAGLAFGALLERSGDSGGIELGPLYDFLIEQKAPQSAVIEVIVFMKSRESRFGVTMTLPPQLSTFTQEDIDSVAQAFTTRGASGGIRAGQSAQQAGQASPVRSQPVSQPTPSTSEFGAAAAEPNPARRQRHLLVALAVFAVLGVASLVYNLATAMPPPTPLVLVDPSGLPCVTPVGTSSTVICRMSKALFEAEAPQAIDARGAITRAAVRAQGYTRVLLYTDEDNKLRKVF